MDAPHVSVCLPTWNGAAHLERLLPALAAQRLPGGFELVALDSTSSDRTPELLAAAGARVETIPQQEFRHGPARNRLAAAARGRVLVFLSQDALPRDADFLATLAAAVEAPGVAAATARILPHPGDDPLTARTALDRPEARAEPLLLGPEDAAGDDGRPRFNDVAAALRAEVWRALPFPEVDFGEDLAWARRALGAGHRIAFVPAAVCFHAHAYTPAQAFARYRVDAAFQRSACGRCVRPDLRSVLRGFAYELRADARHLAALPWGERWAHMARALALRGAQVWGQYRGSRGPLGPAG